MNTQEIARKLVIGQENLDRMKKEIYDVMHLFMGLVRTERGYWKNGDKWTFKSDNCCWEFWVNDCSGPKMFSVICYELHGFGSCTAFAINFNSMQLCLDQIQPVYEDLQTFISGMLKAFPGLEKKIQPFIRAAEKKF